MDIPELQVGQVCAPYIKVLSEEVALPVTVGTRIGDEWVAVAKAVPPYANVNISRIGWHFPLHCTANGKVLIAWLSDEELESLFADLIFHKFTPKTICRLDHLKTHLAEVRKRGFAVNEEEEAIGARSIGAPVFNHIGTVAASVSMGDISQTPLERILRFADNLLGTTKEISRQISAGLGSHEIESRRSLDGWRGPGSLRSVT
jgi:DNA-binding IclR family transcriptional regulator